MLPPKCNPERGVNEKHRGIIISGVKMETMAVGRGSTRILAWLLCWDEVFSIISAVREADVSVTNEPFLTDQT